ncbi:MAG: peptidyl-prolyl cis-trans isomerase [Desulfobacteraceae bacterium]|nr:peptidyl-prolyl cis-trans isomerase [Desulfobacteraceae bacterium]
MRTRLILVLLILTLLVPLSAVGAGSKNPQVVLETSMGNIVLELFLNRATKTVDNFLGYVRWGHYDGTVFHRVIPNFMIQGGGLSSDMKEKSTGMSIENEADNGLKNKRGTVAMARTQDPHSATSQFFINIKDSKFLDHKSRTSKGWGYTVFGKVIEGMDVVDAISKVKTGTKGSYQDVPLEPVVIIKATVKE